MFKREQGFCGLELRQEKGPSDAEDCWFLDISFRSIFTPANKWLLQDIRSFHEPPPLGEDVVLGRRLGVNPSKQISNNFI